jgi:hypothetical protein
MSLSRIEGSVRAAAGEFVRLDAPDALPPAGEVDVLLVDWADRQPGWGAAIAAWRDTDPGHRPRVILFGPHTDLEAHAAARSGDLGPMRARSAFFSSLPHLLKG